MVEEPGAKIVGDGLGLKGLHIDADRDLGALPKGGTFLVLKQVMPGAGTATDLGNGEGCMNRIAVLQRGDEISFNMDNGEANFSLVDHDGVGNAAHGLPCLFKKTVGEIEDSREISDVCPVQHRIVDPTGKLNRHVTPNMWGVMKACLGV